MKLSEALDKVYFTADFHLGHTNILRYCNRPFKSIEEHDRAIIDNFNSILKPDSHIYHIGDFTLSDRFQSIKYINQFIGEWHFLSGSHDKWLHRYYPSSEYSGKIHLEPALLSLQFSISTERPLVIVLCHYAMRRWDRSHYGSYHLYGHSHGGLPGYGRSMDVGVDCFDFKPVSLRQVIELLKDRPIIDNHT